MRHPPTVRLILLPFLWETQILPFFVAVLQDILLESSKSMQELEFQYPAQETDHVFVSQFISL